MAETMERECGVTAISLRNAQRIRDRWKNIIKEPVEVQRIELHNRQGRIFALLFFRAPAAMENDPHIAVHLATGFGWGYGGVAPRGLMTLMREAQFYECAIAQVPRLDRLGGFACDRNMRQWRPLTILQERGAR